MKLPQASILVLLSYVMKISAAEWICPAKCKTCKTGGSADYGLPVSSEGICEYYCSHGGYCGNGPNYKSGVDCRSCFQPKGYELIGKGHCKHASGSFLESCTAFGFKSQRICETECSSIDGCVGYQYKYINFDGIFEGEGLLECTFFPSKNNFFNCSAWYDGWLRNGTGYIKAEIVEELVEGPDDGDVDTCYRRINIYKLQNNLCRDQYFCKEMSKSAISCSKFPTIRESCPRSCGLCSCEDTRNCEGINPWICEVFPAFKSMCPETCGLCTEPLDCSPENIPKSENACETCLSYHHCTNKNVVRNKHGKLITCECLDNLDQN